jgi:type IV pilus assembly protein PilN
MITVNLLDGVQQQQRSPVFLLIRPVLTILLVIVPIFFVRDYTSKMEQELQEKVTALQAEVSTINRKLRQIRQASRDSTKFQSDKGQLEEKRNAISILEQLRVGPVRLLDAISGAIPERAYLEGLNQNNKQINIEGVADTNETISRFLKNLEESIYFREIKLGAVRAKRVEDVNMKSFRITFRAAQF